MATRITDAIQNAAVDAIVDAVDTGAGTAVLQIRTGAQPADADSADAGTLLVAIDLPNPAFAAAAAGSAALNGTPLSGTAEATGTAGHFRIKDRGGTTILDGSVTGSGGGGDIELNNTSIADTQEVEITSYSVSIPASE